MHARLARSQWNFILIKLAKRKVPHESTYSILAVRRHTMHIFQCGVSCVQFTTECCSESGACCDRVGEQRLFNGFKNERIMSYVRSRVNTRRLSLGLNLKPLIF